MYSAGSSPCLGSLSGTPDLLVLLLPMFSEGWNPACEGSAKCLPGHVLLMHYSRQALPSCKGPHLLNCPCPPGPRSAPWRTSCTAYLCSDLWHLTLQVDTLWPQDPAISQQV